MSYPFSSSQSHPSASGSQLNLTDHERSLIRDKLASILLEYVSKDHGPQNSEPRIRDMAFKFEQHIFQTARTRDEYMKTIADKIKQVRQRNQPLSQPSSQPSSQSQLPPSTQSMMHGNYLSDPGTQQIPSHSQPYYPSPMPPNAYGQSSESASTGAMGGLALPPSAAGVSSLGPRPSQHAHPHASSSLLASGSQLHDPSSLQRSPAGAGPYNASASASASYPTAHPRYVSHAAALAATPGLGSSARTIAGSHAQSQPVLPPQHTLSPQQQMTQAAAAHAAGIGPSRGGSGHVGPSHPAHVSALSLGNAQGQQHSMYSAQPGSQAPSTAVRQPSQAQYVSPSPFAGSNTASQGMVNLASFGSNPSSRFPGQHASQPSSSSISGLGITTAAMASTPAVAHPHQRVYSTLNMAASMSRPVGLSTLSHLPPHLQSQAQSPSKSQSQSQPQPTMMRPLYGNRALPLAPTMRAPSMTTAAPTTSISLPPGLSSLQLNGHEKAQMLSRVEYLKHLLPYTDHLMNTCLKIGQVIPPNALEKLSHVKSILLKQTELIEEGIYILSPTKMESFIGHLKRFMAALIQRLKAILPASELARQQRQASAMGPLIGTSLSKTAHETSEGHHHRHSQPQSQSQSQPQSQSQSHSHVHAHVHPGSNTVVTPMHHAAPSLAHIAASAGLESSLLSDFESSGAFDPDASIIEQLERETESLDSDAMMTAMHSGSVSSLDMLPTRPSDRAKSLDYLNEQLSFALDLPEDEQGLPVLDSSSETSLLLQAYLESKRVEPDTLHEARLRETVQLYDQGYQLVARQSESPCMDQAMDHGVKMESDEQERGERLLLLPHAIKTAVDTTHMLEIELPMDYPKSSLPLGIFPCHQHHGHDDGAQGWEHAKGIHRLGDLLPMLQDHRHETTLDTPVPS